MSKQMTEDYIEQEFERWKAKPCYNPFGMDPDNYWLAKSFTLYMLKKHSQKTSTKNNQEKPGSNSRGSELGNCDVSSIPDTDALTNPSLDEVSRIDGRRLNSNKSDVEDSK